MPHVTATAPTAGPSATEATGTGVSSHTFTCSAGLQVASHLLQRGSAELNGDVLELPVLLRAEVADHVGMLIWLSQQLYFTVCKAEALGKNSFHCNITVIECPPADRRESPISLLHSRQNRHRASDKGRRFTELETAVWSFNVSKGKSGRFC